MESGVKRRDMEWRESRDMEWRESRDMELA